MFFLIATNDLLNTVARKGYCCFRACYQFFYLLHFSVTLFFFLPYNKVHQTKQIMELKICTEKLDGIKRELTLTITIGEKVTEKKFHFYFDGYQILGRDVVDYLKEFAKKNPIFTPPKELYTTPERYTFHRLHDIFRSKPMFVRPFSTEVVDRNYTMTPVTQEEIDKFPEKTFQYVSLNIHNWMVSSASECKFSDGKYSFPACPPYDKIAAIKYLKINSEKILPENTSDVELDVLLEAEGIYGLLS